MCALAYRLVVVFLLPDCNMACPFCASERGFDTLGEAQARALVDDLAEAGVTGLVLGGGEPTLWPGDLRGLVEHAGRRGLSVQVASNAVSVPEDFSSWPVSRWVFPLDAADPEVHDRLRRAPGAAPAGPSHHALVLSRCDTLRESGRALTISTVVCPETVADLPALARLLSARHHAGGNLHSWHLYRFVPRGRGGRPNATRFRLPAEIFADSLARVRALGLPFPVYGRGDAYVSATVGFVWAEGGRLVTPDGPLDGLLIG